MSTETSARATEKALSRQSNAVNRGMVHWVLICALLVASAFPFRFHVIGAQTASVFDVVLLAVAVAFVPLRPWRGGWNLPLPYLVLGGISLLLGVLSFLWSSSFSDTAVYVVSTAEGVASFVMVVMLLRGQTERGVVYTICAWIALIVLGSILMYAHVPGFAPAGNLDPTSGNYLSFFTRFSHPLLGRSNNVAALLVAFAPALAVWAMVRKSKVAAGFAIATTILLLATLSRGALVGLGVGLILWLILDRRARVLGERTVAWVAGVIIAAVCIIAVNDDLSTFLTERVFGSRNVDARTNLLGDAWASITRNPWLGIGGGHAADVHNTFVQQVVYFGIIGGILVSAALIWTAVSWFLPKRGTYGKWLSTAAGIGVVAQIVSFVFEASFEGTLLRPLIWLSWGLLYALTEAGRARQNQLGVR